MCGLLDCFRRPTHVSGDFLPLVEDGDSREVLVCANGARGGFLARVKASELEFVDNKNFVHFITRGLGLQSRFERAAAGSIGFGAGVLSSVLAVLLLAINKSSEEYVNDIFDGAVYVSFAGMGIGVIGSIYLAIYVLVNMRAEGARAGENDDSGSAA